MPKTITNDNLVNNSHSSPNVMNETKQLWNATSTPTEVSNLIEQSFRQEATYAELPIDHATTQDKSQDDKNPATQPETQHNFQDAPQNSQATQSKGWASTLGSVPAKIVYAFNPLNWLPNKNSAASQQQNIIKEHEDDSSASLDEEKKPLEQAQNVLSTNVLSALDESTPDDSESKDATSTDPLTGNDSNLLDNN